MGTLSAALAWASRGFSVFPLLENTKDPAYSDDWTEIATRDEAMIRSMWTDPVLRTERNHNIGVLCTGLVVVDIDVKKGKDGYNEYMQLNGHFDTLVVRTPSGGYHCYFYGPDSSNAPITSGIDIRSHNGYVVAPGSVVDGLEYTIVADKDLAWVPPTIEKLLAAPDVRRDLVVDEGTLDTPASIQAAINFLQTCPPAIENQRGDETTFITAARVIREMALTVPTAYALMLEHFNPRCTPPWTPEELLTKIENAHRYGTADIGVLVPELLFAGIHIEKPPSVFDQLGVCFGNAAFEHSIEPRNWLMEKVLMRGAVTLILASGGAGKSSLSLALAAHLSADMPFAKYESRAKCKTIVYNGEDDLAEQSRRLLALSAYYQMNYEEMKKNIMLLSSQQVKFDLASKEFNKPIRNQVLINQIIETASNPDVGLLILDPLVKIHKCDESDNVQMDFVMDILTEIAQKANVAVLVLHHTSKGGQRQEERIGNMDIARGASAVVNAARIAFTLVSASRTDAEQYGFTDDNRHQYVRLDDAKMNLSLLSNEAVWFEKKGFEIPHTKDVIGALVYNPHIKKSPIALLPRFIDILGQNMTSSNTASLNMKTAVEVIKKHEPLVSNKRDKEIASMIEGMFAFGAKTEQYSLYIERDADTDKLTLIMGAKNDKVGSVHRPQAVANVQQAG